MKFTADAKNPYFTYALNANSREKGKDIVEILKNLLEMMVFLQENSEKAESPC